jgi:hypothetical protein
MMPPASPVSTAVPVVASVDGPATPGLIQTDGPAQGGVDALLLALGLGGLAAAGGGVLTLTVRGSAGRRH